MTRQSLETFILMATALVGLIISGLAPFDRLTWFLEVLPVLIAVPVLAATYGTFPLTRLLYWLLLIHGIILMIGGHYTYAQVPIGFWVEELFHLSRNHYDRLGHFAQGFIPAILVREILIQRSPLSPGKWLFFLVTSICLAFSAFYEFIEWWAALLGGESAEAFLGTQGDIWDTQWDMFLAFLGAMSAQILLAGLHDRQLTRILHE